MGLRVVCIGTSLTEGYFDAGRSFHPYHTLWDEKEYDVTNLGVSGALCSRKSKGPWIGASLFQMDADYDVGVFMGGTNDLGYGFDVNHVFDEWKLLARCLKDRCRTVVVCTLPENAWASVEKQRLNDKIRGFARDTPGVYLCEVAKALPYDPDLFDDDLHFNPRGYDALGELIVWVIEKCCRA